MFSNLMFPILRYINIFRNVVVLFKLPPELWDGVPIISPKVGFELPEV